MKMRVFGLSVPIPRPHRRESSQHSSVVDADGSSCHRRSHLVADIEPTKSADESRERESIDPRQSRLNKNGNSGLASDVHGDRKNCSVLVNASKVKGAATRINLVDVSHSSSNSSKSSYFSSTNRRNPSPGYGRLNPKNKESHGLKSLVAIKSTGYDSGMWSLSSGTSVQDESLTSGCSTSMNTVASNSQFVTKSEIRNAREMKSAKVTKNIKLSRIKNKSAATLFTNFVDTKLNSISVSAASKGTSFKHSSNLRKFEMPKVSNDLQSLDATKMSSILKIKDKMKRGHPSLSSGKDKLKLLSEQDERTLSSGSDKDQPLTNGNKQMSTQKPSLLNYKSNGRIRSANSSSNSDASLHKTKNISDDTKNKQTTRDKSTVLRSKNEKIFRKMRTRESDRELFQNAIVPDHLVDSVSEYNTDNEDRKSSPISKSSSHINIRANSNGLPVSVHSDISTLPSSYKHKVNIHALQTNNCNFHQDRLPSGSSNKAQTTCLTDSAKVLCAKNSYKKSLATMETFGLLGNPPKPRRLYSEKKPNAREQTSSKNIIKNVTPSNVTISSTESIKSLGVTPCKDTLNTSTEKGSMSKQSPCGSSMEKHTKSPYLNYNTSHYSVVIPKAMRGKKSSPDFKLATPMTPLSYSLPKQSENTLASKLREPARKSDLERVTRNLNHAFLEIAEDCRVTLNRERLLNNSLMSSNSTIVDPANCEISISSDLFNMNSPDPSLYAHLKVLPETSVDPDLSTSTDMISETLQNGKSCLHNQMTSNSSKTSLLDYDPIHSSSNFSPSATVPTSQALWNNNANTCTPATAARFEKDPTKPKCSSGQIPSPPSSCVHETSSQHLLQSSQQISCKQECNLYSKYLSLGAVVPSFSSGIQQHASNNNLPLEGSKGTDKSVSCRQAFPQSSSKQHGVANLPSFFRNESRPPVSTEQYYPSAKRNSSSLFSLAYASRDAELVHKPPTNSMPFSSIFSAPQLSSEEMSNMMFSPSLRDIPSPPNFSVHPTIPELPEMTPSVTNSTSSIPESDRLSTYDVSSTPWIHQADPGSYDVPWTHESSPGGAPDAFIDIDDSDGNENRFMSLPSMHQLNNINYIDHLSGPIDTNEPDSLPLCDSLKKSKKKALHNLMEVRNALVKCSSIEIILIDEESRVDSDMLENASIPCLSLSDGRQSENSHAAKSVKKIVKNITASVESNNIYNIPQNKAQRKISSHENLISSNCSSNEKIKHIIQIKKCSNNNKPEYAKEEIKRNKPISSCNPKTSHIFQPISSVKSWENCATPSHASLCPTSSHDASPKEASSLPTAPVTSTGSSCEPSISNSCGIPPSVSGVLASSPYETPLAGRIYETILSRRSRIGNMNSIPKDDDNHNCKTPAGFSSMDKSKDDSRRKNKPTMNGITAGYNSCLGIKTTRNISSIYESNNDLKMSTSKNSANRLHNHNALDTCVSLENSDSLHTQSGLNVMAVIRQEQQGQPSKKQLQLQLSTVTNTVYSSTGNPVDRNAKETANNIIDSIAVITSNAVNRSLKATIAGKSQEVIIDVIMTGTGSASVEYGKPEIKSTTSSEDPRSPKPAIDWLGQSTPASLTNESLRKEQLSSTQRKTKVWPPSTRNNTRTELEFLPTNSVGGTELDCTGGNTQQYNCTNTFTAGTCTNTFTISSTFKNTSTSAVTNTLSPLSTYTNTFNSACTFTNTLSSTNTSRNISPGTCLNSKDHRTGLSITNANASTRTSTSNITKNINGVNVSPAGTKVPHAPGAGNSSTTTAAVNVTSCSSKHTGSRTVVGTKLTIAQGSTSFQKYPKVVTGGGGEPCTPVLQRDAGNVCNTVLQSDIPDGSNSPARRSQCRGEISSLN